MTEKKDYPEAQNPLILRASRLIEAFAKSNDERDYYLDRIEGFILYLDLDKSQETLDILEQELQENSSRYCLIPKMSFYETKKIMESFVNEKVYDIDTKEKLLDIIQSKEARENFLEFIYDQHTELEKWQQYYQERSRIRIIEWLRKNHFHFVFEEDLDIGVKLIEKLKEQLFSTKIGKDIASARKALFSKAKTYYSNEALNPRPKRGRPPKQQAKMEIEHHNSSDIYTTIAPQLRIFLFTPDGSNISAATFSAKYESEEELLKSRGLLHRTEGDEKDIIGDLNKKLASLRDLSSRWMQADTEKKAPPAPEPVRNNNNHVLPVKVKNVEPSHTLKQPASKIEKKVPALKKNPTPVKAAAPVEKEAPKKAPLRSIIKKPAETKAPAKPKPKKTVQRKRIIPKETEKASTKKPLRKIIPKPPKK